jgi:hypothetical protein
MFTTRCTGGNTFCKMYLYLISDLRFGLGPGGMLGMKVYVFAVKKRGKQEKGHKAF